MSKRFAVVGEGQPDHIVLERLVHGFFNDKTIVVNRLRPEKNEPFGWTRVFGYISTQDFRNALLNTDYCIVQIDTNECEQWHEGIEHIGNETSEAIVNKFVEKIKAVLITKIGKEYSSLEKKIIFAITVHDLECWLLPFNSNLIKEQSKIFSCKTTIQKIASIKHLSIAKDSDPYRRIDSFIELSKEMRNHKVLLKKSKLNSSLGIFIEEFVRRFPIDKN